MKDLGSVNGDGKIQLSTLVLLIEALQVGEIGILTVNGQQFEVARMPNSSTFMLGSGGVGIANGSSAEVAEALRNEVMKYEVGKHR